MNYARPARDLVKRLFARRKTQEDEPRHPIAEWAVTFLLLLFGSTTLVQAYVIPTGSMEDTLLVGDHVLVDKLAYSPAGPISKHLLPYQEVKRGDIIVFRRPDEIKTTLVKRVIGVPGDRVHLENKRLFINGVPMRERYKMLKTPYYDSYRDSFPAAEPNFLERPANLVEMLGHHIANRELVVPAGHYFAMGDNRDHSLDSRYWGLVPRENIIGKPLLIYWSYDTTTARLSGALIDPEHIADLAMNFFTKTRWERTFRLIRPSPVE